MRARWLITFALGLGLGIAPALAQDAEQPRSLESLTEREIEHEQQANNWQGPSGFWTSPHRSKHGAYRYRMMLIGIGLAGLTGFVTWRLIRRANAERAARS